MGAKAPFFKHLKGQKQMQEIKMAKQDKQEKLAQKMVKVQFNQPMQNKSLTTEQLAAAKKEYVEEIKSIHGRDMAFPNEPEMIALKVRALYNQPLTYLKGELYEMTEEEAKKYTSVSIDYIPSDDRQPKYFDNAKDMKRFKEKFHFAEIVD